MKPEDRLDHMRKRPVADVVEQGGDADGGLLFVGNGVAEAEFRDHASRQMKGPETVREPRMFGSLIRKIGEAKLPNSTKALKFRRIDKRDDQLALGRIGVYADDVVNRVAVDPF